MHSKFPEATIEEIKDAFPDQATAEAPAAAGDIRDGRLSGSSASPIAVKSQSKEVQLVKSNCIPFAASISSSPSNHSIPSLRRIE